MKDKNNATKKDNPNAIIENAGIIIDQQITNTLEKNYMPYAMSVIVSRAIPEIDGFKPSHRKLLYTMFKMGLSSSQRTKSANVVGQTMRLNPHGDVPIYETMVRLSKGYGVLLHPYIDSKGNFGKSYSRDMAYAASRYTEVKLDPICEELFLDIEKNTVDFIDNYDNTTKEPLLLPVSFPSILVNSNVGIAVGMASCIPSFNLEETCQTAIEMIKNDKHDIITTLRAPDFSTGGQILYDENEMRKIYENGRGNFKVRGKCAFNKVINCLEITEIPPTTTVESIIDKIIELSKIDKMREVADIRDETDLKGLKIAIDIKRGTDIEKFIVKLCKYTSFEDTFSCNFNILINGKPKTIGIKEILSEWTVYRENCIKRRMEFEISKKKDKLHLLYGLKKILLDIDKAIKIIRNTKLEQEVIINLINGFNIDKTQAEYVADIKLRNLNEEYMIKGIKEIFTLEKDIELMQETLASKKKILALIVKELSEVSKKFSKPRRTELFAEFFKFQEVDKENVAKYPVHLFFTKDGYLKKITPLSLRMSNEQKIKDGDKITQSILSNNLASLLFFTNKYQVYKTRASDFNDTKASVMGEYVAVTLGMDNGEIPIYMSVIDKYIGYMLFFFEDGKVAKVSINSYETKTNRKKLISAYSKKSPLIGMAYIPEDSYFIIKSIKSRCLILDTRLLSVKSSKDTIGVSVLALKKGDKVSEIKEFTTENLDFMSDHIKRMVVKNIPSPGVLSKNNLEQLVL